MFANINGSVTGCSRTMVLSLLNILSSYSSDEQVHQQAINKSSFLQKTLPCIPWSLIVWIEGSIKAQSDCSSTQNGAITELGHILWNIGCSLLLRDWPNNMLFEVVHWNVFGRWTWCLFF